MTPLTHAAVGAAIYQQFRSVRRPAWTWVAAFPLAFLSHYALDAIPHFEGTLPIIRPMQEILVMLGFGLIGTILAALMLRWNRELGTIWIVIALWIGLGPFTLSSLRMATALSAVLCIAWLSKRAGGNPLPSVGYVLAAITGFAPDVLPASWRALRAEHIKIHYRRDWGTMLHHAFSQKRVPHGLIAQLHDGYFVAGYALEIAVEGAIFFGALYLATRGWSLPEQPTCESAATDLELSQKI